jgi:AcrR family transcriptional regulator
MARRGSAALRRDRILDAALKLADDAGLDALSMRRLGEALGVEAMSLYNHVANKDAILDGIVARVLTQVALPSPDGDWEDELRRCAVSLHEALREHPWACSLVMAPAAGPEALEARMRYIDALLRTLREAGFTPDEAYYAYHAIDGHTVGFTMWELGHESPWTDAAVETAMRVIESGDFPYLVEHAQQHELDHDVGGFEFGLDLVFDGLRRQRRKPRSGAASRERERRDSAPR